jgi:enhancer of mRNA-decapping protein 3
VQTPLAPVRSHFDQTAPPSQRPSIAPTLQHENSIPIPVPQPQPDQFVDPAILSFGRKPSTAPSFTAQGVQPAPQEAPSTPVKIIPSTALDALPQNTSPFIGAPKPTPVKKSVGRKKGRDAAATLKAPFSNLDINSAAEQEHLDDTDEPLNRHDNIRRVSLTKTRTGKPMDDAPQASSVGKKNNKKKKGPPQPAVEDETTPEMARKGNGTGTFRGKGWRQTPILQDPPPTTSPRAKQTSKKQRALELEAQNNGWATEDATDIQELGEFDFAGNLSKFDKRTVFAQIKTEDTTADDERLVSFNRTPARPGTYGGKNLHPTENVLDSPKLNARRTSLQDSDTDATFDIESVRATKRTISRASSRRPSHRQNSVMVEDPAVIREVPRVPRSLRGGGYTGSSSHPTIGSPTPGRFTPPESPSVSQLIQGAHFRIDTSNRPCPTITPGVMAAIEEVAEVDFALTSEIMTESAGRGIAEVAMVHLTGSKRPARETLRSVAIVFVGNHRAGARALAAARHLRGRGVRVVACILGSDRKAVELEREVRKQAETLSKLGGVVRGWSDIKAYLKRIDGDAQPELIIDALLAPGKTFDSLGVEDQRAVVEMVTWINKPGVGKHGIISIDMPSGLNGSTGMPSLIYLPLPSVLSSIALFSPIQMKSKVESKTPSPSLSCAVENNKITIGESSHIDGGDSLQVRATDIVCLGAPRTGLLRALQRASVTATSAPHEILNWQIFVVDIGVNKAWKQSGMASSRGVRFGTEWIVPLKLFEGAEDGRS